MALELLLPKLAEIDTALVDVLPLGSKFTCSLTLSESERVFNVDIELDADLDDVQMRQLELRFRAELARHSLKHIESATQEADRVVAPLAKQAEQIEGAAEGRPLLLTEQANLLLYRRKFERLRNGSYDYGYNLRLRKKG